MCKKRKLACFNFNALILETGTNGHNLSKILSDYLSLNLANLVCKRWANFLKFNCLTACITFIVALVMENA